MSVASRDRRAVGGTTVAAVVLVGLLALLAAPGGGTSVATAPLTSFATSSPCPGAQLPHNYTGAVAVYDEPSPPSVALRVTYRAAETIEYPNGVVISTACANESATAASTTDGAFAFSIDPTAVSNCSSDPSRSQPCATFVGPYEAVGVAPSALPASEFSSTDQNGTAFSVAIDPYLASVRLSPGPSSATFSSGALDAVSAEAFTGAGNRTPFAPTFDWTLEGTGWTFVGGATGPNVNVTAVPGAGVGNVSVVASLTVNGTSVARSTSEPLVAVATSITSAGLNRTAIDVGQSVAVSVVGTAAAGYQYVATFDPGLGQPDEAAPCGTAPSIGGTVVLSCPATWAYGTTGVAQPSVTVSNGASVASWTLSEVTVNPAPLLTVTPASPVGYASTPLSIAIQSAPGTGTAPFSEACLDPGAGRTLCDATAGPTWTFDPVYPSPGNYSATAWSIDAVGVNRSVAVPVRVVAPLSVALDPIARNASAGAPLALSAVVTGGDLPARLWWNASGEAAPLATAWVTADGTVRASFVPPTPGFVTLSVAVTDALGTTAWAVATVPVALGVATEAVAVGLPPTVPVRAGTAFGVAWQAIDVGGSDVRNFATAAEIELTVAGTDRAAPGTANASGAGALASPVPGWFDVPSSAWLGGALNVSIACDVAGAIEVELSVAVSLPGGTSAVGVTVLPDIDHLVLFQPDTVRSTARSADTLWQVTDRFGNAAGGASLVLTTSWSAGTSRVVVPVLTEADGATEAWVNYTVPGSWAGTVTVSDLAGAAVLPTIVVPGLAGPLAELGAVPVSAAVAAGGLAGGVTFWRRPRRTVTPVLRTDDADLERLAVGRAAVVDLVAAIGPVDLAGLATLWHERPVPGDLPDWVASLRTDGTLAAVPGDDGVERFVLAAPAPEPPAVTVDVEEIDRVSRRRAALEAEWDDGPP